MPQVGFEPMIPVFERVRTVHALDRATSVMGNVDALARTKTQTVIYRTYYVNSGVKLCIDK
jgi:hypothetical protein